MLAASGMRGAALGAKLGKAIDCRSSSASGSRRSVRIKLIGWVGTGLTAKLNAPAPTPET